MQAVGHSKIVLSRVTLALNNQVVVLVHEQRGEIREISTALKNPAKSPYEKLICYYWLYYNNYYNIYFTVQRW